MDHIDVLQKSIDAYKIWSGYFPHLTKLHRYSLGVKIDEKFLDFVDAVYFSIYSSKESRSNSIRIVSQKLDLLKLSLRIAWEIKALDNKKYSVISIPLAEIGKIIGGWKQQLKK
ncbi:MAG: four helix bundle protein [bacterium]|nr:four helix bundle protein [bacterium]